jgi:HPt (histidine-containing phosphotransfer) domain-containing protein
MEIQAKLNLDFLNEFCRGDKKKMAVYMNTFLESFPEQIQLIQLAASDGKWTELNILLHSLKPQVIFVGLTSVQSLIEKIELETVQDSAAQNIPMLISQLERAAERSIDAIIHTLVTLS